jgi:hypothetical protein
VRRGRAYSLWAALVAFSAAIALVLVPAADSSSITQPYQTYESTVGGDQPSVQYRFDDAAGSTTLADSAGTDTATNNGIVLGRLGPFGGSGSGKFASGAYAAMQSFPLTGATAFTAEAWINWAGGGYNQQVFDLGSSSTSFMALTPSASSIGHRLVFEIRSGSSDFSVSAPGITQAWHYVVVTETSGVLALYVDGKRLSQTSGVTVSPQTLGSPTSDWLGKSLNSGDPPFAGSLSNVAFYAQALSASQILAHWNAAEFPANTAAPSVAGASQVGQTLTASNGSWSGASPITFAYQWQSCVGSGGGTCSNISSATAQTYQVQSTDVGNALQVVVTGTNGSGSSSAASASTAAVSAAPSSATMPSISGTPGDGQTLAANPGTWNGTQPISYSYQWQTCDASGSNCSNNGSTGQTYQLGPNDVGTTLVVVVTASNSVGSSTATSAPTLVVAEPPAATAPPSVSGTVAAGQTLNASPGTWSGSQPMSFAYQWQNCDPSGAYCWNIAGDTSSSYQVGAWQQGETVSVTVTASNNGGSASASAPVSAPVPATGVTAPTYFPASFFDQPLASDVPLDSQSSQMDQELTDEAFGVSPLESYNCRHSTYLYNGAAPGQNQPTQWTSQDALYCHQVGYKAGVNTASDTPTLYTVGPDQPTVAVQGLPTIDLQTAMSAVPIPAGAQASSGGDAQMIIWQPSSDTMWELWKASQDSAGQWHAAGGGRIMNVSSDPGFYRIMKNTNSSCSTNPNVKLCEGLWGGAASHIPNLPGLMTLAQLQSGHVDHALIMAVPNAMADAYSWPAQATDGQGNALIPEGARFRLDPSLNIDSWFAGLVGADGQPRPIAPIDYIIAKTLQTYGAVVNNTSGSISFYAENYAPSGNDIFDGATGLFGGMKPFQFTSDLPWEHMQFLQTNMCNQPQSGSGLYQTPCTVPTAVTPPQNWSGTCVKPLSVSPQPGYANPPTVSITSPNYPNDGMDRIAFHAAAYDPTGISHVDFLVDGQLRYTATHPVCTMNQTQYAIGGNGGYWDASTEPFGNHTLQVNAYDSEGNEASASYTVTLAPNGSAVGQR